MKPGKELDALIAEKIFDLDVLAGKVVTPHEFLEGTHYSLEPEAYSTNITAAWKIVERLNEQFLMVSVDSYLGGADIAILDKKAEGHYQLTVSAKGDDACHAICLVALKLEQKINSEDETH